MATNYGYDGSLWLGSTGAYTTAANMDPAAHITKWNMSVETDALEVTDFGDKDRTYVPGLRNVTATFEGYFSDTDTGQYRVTSRLTTGAAASKIQAVLRYYSTTGGKKGWKGAGVLTNASIDVPNDGIQTISGTIQFAGGVSAYSS